MNRKHRVLHLITLLELGGAQQNTLYSVRHHDRSRFDVELIAGKGGQLDDVARAIPDAKVQLVPWLKHPISPWSDMRAVFRLRDYFREAKVDVVHTHSSKAGILGRMAAHLAEVPAIVHTVHGWSFNPTQPWMRRRVYSSLERVVAPMTDRMLVVAERHIDLGVREGIGRRRQYSVMRSGIDIEEFARSLRTREEVRRELGYGPEDFVVGTISNMKAQKAPLDFVETAARAHQANPALRFFYAGDGELRPKVEQRIAETGIGDAVQLLGWREDAVDLLHAMDGFLLTSRFEGLPRVVLQAMAAGTPVVATEVDGTPEVVEHGVTGLLAEAGDTTALAAHVDRIAKNEAECEAMVAAARQRLNESFDIRKMVADLDELYATLLQHQAGSDPA